MLANTEISALLHLMDDPDEEVFSSVSSRLLTYGPRIIPNLEDLWENTFEAGVQQRIEFIIQKLQFNHLYSEIKEWSRQPEDLFTGAFLMSQFVYPNLEATNSLREIEQMRRNIWLELNSFQNPLEQAGIISGVLYVYFKIQSIEIRYQSKDEFLFHKVLENGKGNAVANGILYLILAKMLDVPIKAVNIPKQFLLAYFDTEFDYKDSLRINTEKLSFFIDPLSGQIYSRQNVESYIKKMGLTMSPSYFKPINYREVVKILALEISKCYLKESNEKKVSGLEKLIKLLDD